MRIPNILDWIIFLVLSLVWGCSFIMIKYAVRAFDPIQMSMWRTSLSTVMFLPMAIIYRKQIVWKSWKPLVVVALFGSAIPSVLFGAAQRHVDSSLAGILNSMTPLFTLLTGAFFFGLHWSWSKLAGVILGLAGAAVLVWYGASGHSGGAGNNFYAALCVLATLCYAINANNVNTNLRGHHPAAIASASFVLLAPVFFSGLWFSGAWTQAWTHPEGLRSLISVAYLAALGTVASSVLYFRLIQNAGPVFASSVTYALPVIAMGVGAFDGETITWIDGLGTAIIFTGLYLARK